MACTGMITMSMRELDRLKVVEAVAGGWLMPWRAAERLGISRRQVERLVLRYRASGASGLVSRRRGNTSNHPLPEGLAQRPPPSLETGLPSIDQIEAELRPDLPDGSV
jgi:hypothetical protein